MPDPKVTIRQARLDDIETIVAITAEVFAPFAMEHHIEKMIGAAEGVRWIDVKGDDLRRELGTEGEGCFVAELEGRPVGYVTTTINERAQRGNIPNIAVLADAQGHRIGRALLETALEYFRSKGLRQAKIETLSTNETGQHLYPSLGFREVVRQIHYVMALD